MSCGTEAGARRHKRLHERPCDRCQYAEAAIGDARRLGIRTTSKAPETFRVPPGWSIAAIVGTEVAFA